MPAYTPNYNLAKPLVADAVDEDLWGGQLNDDLDIIDTQMKANADAAAAAAIRPKRAYVENTNVYTISSVFSATAIPQITDGVEMLSGSLPSLNSTSSRVRVTANIPNLFSTTYVAALGALFVNGGPNAVQADIEYFENGPGIIGNLSLTYEYAPASIASQTASVRIGIDRVGSYQVGRNAAATPFFGNIGKMTLIMEEIFV